LVAVDCFLPGRAKNLSAPRYNFGRNYEAVKRQLKTPIVRSAYAFSCVFHLVIQRKVGEPLFYRGVIFT